MDFMRIKLPKDQAQTVENPPTDVGPDPNGPPEDLRSWKRPEFEILRCCRCHGQIPSPGSGVDDDDQDPTLFESAQLYEDGSHDIFRFVWCNHCGSSFWAWQRQQSLRQVDMGHGQHSCGRCGRRHQEEPMAVRVRYNGTSGWSLQVQWCPTCCKSFQTWRERIVIAVQDGQYPARVLDQPYTPEEEDTTPRRGRPPKRVTRNAPAVKIVLDSEDTAEEETAEADEG